MKACRILEGAQYGGDNVRRSTSSESSGCAAAYHAVSNGFRDSTGLADPAFANSAYVGGAELWSPWIGSDDLGLSGMPSIDYYLLLNNGLKISRLERGRRSSDL